MHEVLKDLSTGQKLSSFCITGCYNCFHNGKSTALCLILNAVLKQLSQDYSQKKVVEKSALLVHPVLHFSHN